ncbi:transposase [Bacillus pseudomycoides]|uniref:transposase n=1 Tax=Bacillus pseudomycoides TaxID=64104 RepID=UPI0027BA2F13|nr:transposase [Bacillus pseudomycoides]
MFCNVICHEKIANQRNDLLHKISNVITNENQVIVIEDLKVKNMQKNHKLAKAISGVS